MLETPKLSVRLHPGQEIQLNASLRWGEKDAVYRKFTEVLIEAVRHNPLAVAHILTGVARIEINKVARD